MTFEKIFIQFAQAEAGNANIRKWSQFPFAGAGEYALAAQAQSGETEGGTPPPQTHLLVTHIRPTVEGDSVEYAYKVCATGDDGAIPVYFGPPAHISVSSQMVGRFIDAVEGELDGLAIDTEQAMAILAYTIAGETTPQPHVRPLELLDPADDAAIEWVTANLMAIRRDDGSMHYGLTDVVRAFQAGSASVPPPAPNLPPDVFSVHDGGNSIMLHFAEIKSARAFRDTFPASIVTPSPETRSVGVQPLKWERVVGDVEVAGSYKIDRMRPWTAGKPKKYWVQIALGFGFKTVATMCATLEDAKAAAQADHEERTRGVLTRAPQTKKPGVAGDCPCTKLAQDETCPVGYPSLLCEECDGKGVVQARNFSRVDTSILRERISRAIFDPGMTEGHRTSMRTQTDWQTDAVMRVLGFPSTPNSGETR